MASTDKYRHHFHRDLLVIGNNLTALLCAEQARQAGQNVALLVGDERLQLGPAIEHLPDTAIARELLTWLEALLQTPIQVNTVEAPALTFEEGQLKTFLGFGDRQVKSVDELSPFLGSSRLVVEPSLLTLGQELANQRQSMVLFRKEPTKLLLQDGQLSGVEINGEELWTAKQVIMATDLDEFLYLMPNEVFDSRARTKITRAHFWSALTVRFEHCSQFALPPEQATTPVHLLTGGSQDFEPIMGFFETSEQGLASRWQLLIAADRTEDHDHLGQALKHIKRQIKRVYPHGLDDLRDEKVALSGRSFGHLHLKLKSDFTFSDLPGLTLALPLLSQEKGWLALLDQAKKFAPTEPVVNTQGLSALTEL